MRLDAPQVLLYPPQEAAPRSLHAGEAPMPHCPQRPRDCASRAVRLRRDCAPARHRRSVVLITQLSLVYAVASAPFNTPTYAACNAGTSTMRSVPLAAAHMRLSMGHKRPPRCELGFCNLQGQVRSRDGRMAGWRDGACKCGNSCNYWVMQPLRGLTPHNVMPLGGSCSRPLARGAGNAPCHPPGHPVGLACPPIHVPACGHASSPRQQLMLQLAAHQRSIISSQQL
jgi:hypothetical protein